MKESVGFKYRSGNQGAAGLLPDGPCLRAWLRAGWSMLCGPFPPV